MSLNLTIKTFIFTNCFDTNYFYLARQNSLPQKGSSPIFRRQTFPK